MSATLLMLAVIDETFKVSDEGPYVFMGLTLAIFAGVGLMRWRHEHRRKLSIKREQWNTMSRAEQRRARKEDPRSEPR